MIHNVVFVIIHFNKHVPVDVKWDFNSKSIVAICLWITLTGHSNQMYNNCIRKKSLKIPKEKSEAKYASDSCLLSIDSICVTDSLPLSIGQISQTYLFTWSMYN
jgi:hypothetical protein